MKSWGVESCGDPCLSSHCFTHPGCWMKVPCCCCGKLKGTIATPCLAAGFPEGPTWWSSVKSWKVSLSVSSPQRRMWGVCVWERERGGWISSCHWWLWASCFLFSNLYINTVHLISLTDQKRQSGGCSGSRRGLGTGYECVCAYARRRDVTQANLPLLWLGRCYFVHLKDVKTGGSLTFVIAKSQWQLIPILVCSIIWHFSSVASNVIWKKALAYSDFTGREME